MPYMVSELSQGKSFSRSSQGGSLADTITRTFRIILSAPDEFYVIPDAIQIQIGDLYPGTDVPCISFDDKADGDSRMVRIVTANYQTTPGNDDGSGGGTDPGSYSPDVRPANFSTSSSLVQVPVMKWNWLNNGVLSGIYEPAVNPVGERYDGTSKLVPSVTISITQYDTSPTRHLNAVGMVNETAFAFGDITIPVAECMLRGISNNPHVESFGPNIFRGWLRTYEFAYCKQLCQIEQIVEGFSCRQNDGFLGLADVDDFALSLKHDGMHQIVVPLALSAGVAPISRAMCAVPREDKQQQLPCVSPVPLNLNGSPRKRGDTNLPPLTQFFVTQPVMDFGANFSGFGIRLQ